MFCNNFLQFILIVHECIRQELHSILFVKNFLSNLNYNRISDFERNGY